MQTYRIAGLRVRMDSWGRTLAQAEGYRADFSGEADITIASQPEVLQKSQPHLSLDDCEYLCTGGSFYRQLLAFDGLLLHASAVVANGFAYLFSAPCGTGKSTHTGLWLREFGPDGASILNDDKPALRREAEGWFAYGTPWSGKTDANENRRVRLGGVCVLRRGPENKLEPYGGAKAVFDLLEQTARPMDGGSRGKLLELLDGLLQDVPVWRMECTPTAEAAKLARNEMETEAIRRFGPQI